MSNYYEWKDFANIYLEDSYVAQFTELDDEFIFEVEFVLTEAHPLYQQPKLSENYCYRRGRILFTQVISVVWKNKIFLEYTDAKGEKDYGNIDVFRKNGNQTYEISGDWGELEIIASQVKIIFD